MHLLECAFIHVRFFFSVIFFIFEDGPSFCLFCWSGERFVSTGRSLGNSNQSRTLWKHIVFSCRGDTDAIHRSKSYKQFIQHHGSCTAILRCFWTYLYLHHIHVQTSFKTCFSGTFLLRSSSWKLLLQNRVELRMLRINILFLKSLVDDCVYKFLLTKLD